MLEEDLDYAERVLKEALKHSSASPEAVLITLSGKGGPPSV